MSPPWFSEQPLLRASFVCLGRVESIARRGPLDQYFVLYEAECRVLKIFRAPAAAAPPATIVVRYAGKAEPAAEAPMVDGIFRHYQLSLGQEIALFRLPTPGQLDWLFLGPRLVDWIRSSETTLGALKEDAVKIMGADEPARRAQLQLYRQMREYIEARPDPSGAA